LLNGLKSFVLLFEVSLSVLQSCCFYFRGHEESIHWSGFPRWTKAFCPFFVSSYWIGYLICLGSVINLVPEFWMYSNLWRRAITKKCQKECTFRATIFAENIDDFVFLENCKCILNAFCNF
jgi:hypothetical protein